MKRPIVAALALLVLALAFILALGQDLTLPNCAEEDGSGGPTPCVWNAEYRGNSVGQSFIIPAR